MSCPDENVLLAYGDGLLARTNEADVERHLDQCTPCRELLSDFVRSGSFEVLDSLPAPEGGPLGPGQRVGRYELHAALGRGAMSRVFSADDRELGRRVALKFLDVDDPQLRERLLREAQILARLSHPNVVQVFEVGSVAGQLFIVMEFVDGLPLSHWLAQRRAAGGAVREILGALLQAARGLAAAHDAGIVHRDFKPSNAIVGRDDRVRVLDFGLAAPVDRTEVREGELVTEPGAVVGTPAYMAPEQLEGTSDAKSDQYGWCVAAYEALTGTRPLPDPTPPVRRGLPRAAARLIAQGLRRDPAERVESMRALADGIEGALGTRWSLRVAVAAAAAGLVGIAIGTQASPGCTRGAELFAEAWGVGDRAAIDAAVQQLGTAYAKEAAPRIGAALDEYATAWSDAWDGVCEARRNDEVTEAIAAVQQECLRNRLAQVEALVDLFATTDEEVARRSVIAAATLPDLSACTDPTAATHAPPPPPPGTADRVATVRRELTEVRAALDAGRFQAALPRAQAAADIAATMDYAPLHAEALWILGVAHADLGELEPAADRLRAAVREAEIGAHDEVRAQAAVRLIDVVGVQLGEHAEGEVWQEAADGVLARLADPPRLRAAFWLYVGRLRFDRGAFDEAEAAYGRALDVADSAVQIASAQYGLGSAVARAGRRDEALVHFDQALQTARDLLGPSHPRLARYLEGSAALLAEMSRHDEALALLEQARRLEEDAFGPDNPAVATVLGNIGFTLMMSNRPDDAVEPLTRALAILDAERRADHPTTAWVADTLAKVHSARGDLALARPLAERAYEARRAALGEDHVSLADSLSSLGSVALLAGDTAAAVDYHERMLALLLRIHGPDHPDVATARKVLERTRRAAQADVTAVKSE